MRGAREGGPAPAGEPGVEWGRMSSLSVTDVAEASGSAWPWAVGPGAGSWGDAE